MKPYRPTTRRPPPPVLAVALAACAAAPALAADWVVRPVRVGPNTGGDNVDVLVTPTGVAVGYTMPGEPSPYLSYLPTDQKYFTHKTTSSIGAAASFAVDPSGQVVYGAKSSSNTFRLGTDTGGWGLGMIDGPVTSPSLFLRTPFPVMAVDSRGIPAFAATDTAGQRVLTRFDVPSATWQSQGLPGPFSQAFPFFNTGFTYTPDDRPVVAYISQSTGSSRLAVAVGDGSAGWRTYADMDVVSLSLGVSVAASPDGRIGVAYPSADGIRLATFDGLAWSIQTIAAGAPAYIAPRSLTVDADGSFALAYAPQGSPSSPDPVRLARETPGGVWATETLPLSAAWATVTFDSANNPFVAAFDGRNVLLAGTTLPSLRASDLTFDDTVTAADVPALAQAILHPSTFLTSRPEMSAADLVAIADRDGDVKLTTNDARLFLDSLSTSPVPGLATRTAGYLAVDDADLDPAVGTGTGNFFGTLLSTGEPYSAGDSRADVTGPAGVADGVIDALEIMYLQSPPPPPPAPGAPDLASPLATPLPDPRLDLNEDGSVDLADVHVLLFDILDAADGDANLNGLIDPDDYLLLDRGYALVLATPGWHDGDFNLDGSLTPADYLLIDAAFLQQQGGSLAPDFLSGREARFGSDYVSSLLASVPEPSTLGLLLASVPLAARRRRVRFLP